MKKLGRLPRSFNPAVKTMKAFFQHATLPPAPLMVDNTRGVKQWGMMLNDRLGDCTCAGIFHARQVWTNFLGGENTQPDAEVLKLYEAACGYRPGDESTDNGGIEQNVLRYCMNEGVPLADGTTDKFLGFAEVNHTKLDEVKLAIAEFGLAYIGFQVPQSIYDANGEPRPVWNYTLNSPIEGGHCVILVGYNNVGFQLISWGEIYTMSYSFFQRYCDEVYAIVSKDWIAATGKTPLGMSLADLEALMKELR